MRIRNILFAVFLATSTSIVSANDFDNGVAAYDKQDYKTALRLFEKAAKQGMPSAQTNLGFMYDNGQGIPKDYAEAVKWYRLAAQQEFTSAQFNLGAMYYMGHGVPKDYVKAYLWFSLAAMRGDEDSFKQRDIAATKLSPQQIALAQKMALGCIANEYKGCN